MHLKGYCWIVWKPVCSFLSCTFTSSVNNYSFAWHVSQFCLTSNILMQFSYILKRQCCHQHDILETTKGKKNIWNDKHYVSSPANAMHAWQLPPRAPNRVLITRKIILWRIFGRQPTEFGIQKWKMHILNNFSGFWCSWESVWWQETMTCDH